MESQLNSTDKTEGAEGASTVVTVIVEVGSKIQSIPVASAVTKTSGQRKTAGFWEERSAAPEGNRR